MHLSDRHRSFLIIEQSVFAGLINVVINGGFVWLLMRDQDTIPLWGDPSMGNDLLATGFLLPFITCMIVSRLVRHQVMTGRLPALEPDQIRPLGIHRRSVWTRSLLVGVLGVVFFAAPIVTILDLAQASPVPFGAFLVFKSIWAGLFAMVVSPVIGWWALAAASSALAKKLTPATSDPAVAAH
jgi:hypothetical protein